MATFKILDTINILDKGFALVGIIIDNGNLSIGDSIFIPKDNKIVEIQILSVETIDIVSEKTTHIGIVISTADKDKIKGLDLKGTEIKTQIPIRGADVQLAGSYGVGAKWWSGIVLLVIIGLITWLFVIFM